MTLRPKKERRPRLRDKVRLFDTLPKQRKEKASYDTRLKSEKTYDTHPQKRITDIGLSLGWEIRTIQHETLTGILHKLVKSGLQRTEPNPKLSRVIHRIEKIYRRKMDMKRFFISNSIRYCYFGIRQTVPKLKAFEKIAEGIFTKDVKKIGIGLVESITGEFFATILIELIE